MRPAAKRQSGIRLRLLIFGGLIGIAGRAWAGRPFLTDDPQPVPLHDWELYLASQSEIGSHGGIATLPHIETNYGAAPGLQLHLIVPRGVGLDQRRQRELGPGRHRGGREAPLLRDG